MPELHVTLHDDLIDEIARRVAERNRLTGMEVPALMSVDTAGRLIGRSGTTVRRRIRDGLLPGVRDDSTGQLMVRGDDLLAYVNRLERVGGRPARARRPRSSRTERFDFLHE